MLIDLFDILCGTKKSIVIDAKLVKGSNYSNKYIVTWDFDREVFFIFILKILNLNS